MTKFVCWLRAIGFWLRRVPIVGVYWWAIAVVIASVAVTGLCGWTEKAFRITGMFLQLGGVLTVVWGILKTRSDFGQPTVRSQFKSWFKEFPSFHPRQVTSKVTIDASLSGLFGDIYAYSTHGPATDTTLEGRVKHLEGIVKELSEGQAKAQIAVRRAEQKAQEALNAQSSWLVVQIADVSKRVETTATGGVHLSAVGVVLLFVGTVFGGAAPELGNWLAMARTL